MNFLFFNWMDIANPAGGGAEVYSHEIAKGLVKRGHEVSFFASAFREAPPRETIDGVEIYRAGNRYTVYLEARRHYRKYFKGRFDVVVDVVNTVPFFTPKFARNGEKIFPLIFQLAREFWFEGTGFPINVLGYYFFEKRWLRLYRQYPALTISESSKADLESLGFTDVTILPVGIDFKPLDRLPQHKEPETTLIFTGRLKSTKKPQDALAAYKIIRKEIPETKLWIVGDGEMRPELEAAADENVTLWGYVPAEKKRALMSRAHIILVPGLREGWGLIVTEANAMGTPAVAYDVHGLRDSTRNQVTGLLCPENTPEGMASKALQLLRDPALYRRLSEEALSWSRTFSWDTVTEDFLMQIQQHVDRAAAGETKGRVVVVAEVTMPPLSRANLRIVKLAEALTRAGYPVTMLTPSYTPFTRKSYYQNDFFMNQFWGCCKYMYSRTRVVIRLWHLAGTILSLIYMHIRFSNISILHAWNPLAGIAATIAGKILKVPVYIDFTDFYSDIARTDSPLLVRALAAIEKSMLHSAAKVFVVSRRMRDELGRWGIDPGKVFIVPDGTDAVLFSPSVSGESVRNKHSLGNAPVIMYHGDIKEPDGVDLLYRAFVNIRQKVSGVKLLVLGGGGPYFKHIVRLGRELGIHSDIIYTGWVPHTEVPAYIAASDVGAMPMRATLNHECYLSFKLFEYWGAGKPVIVSRLESISEIVSNGHNGLVHDSEDIEGMAEAYCGLLTEPDQAVLLGRNGRKLVEERFNWEKLMTSEVQAYTLGSSI